MADENSWLRRHGPETLVGAVLVAAVTTGLTVGVPLLAGGGSGEASGPPAPTAAASTTEPPSCTLTACDGLDPNKTHCAPDARTLAEDSAGGMRVSVRYSPSCRTVWGKLTGATVGDTIEIATSPGKKEQATVQYGETKYTPMLPAPKDFSAQATGTSVKGDPRRDLPPGHRLPVGADRTDVPQN